MFPRQLEAILRVSATQYPVITIVGPRQSGKTTLARQTFIDKPYVNLEAPHVRAAAIADPIGFLNQFPDGAILDEIQNTPELLSYIQVIVDEKEFQGHAYKGLFILTGSHQLALQGAISQSLAGRTALLHLLPLSLYELQQANIDLSLDETLLRGFYPRIYKDNLPPYQTYQGYFETYVEKDVRQLINIKDLSLFEKFIRLCAGRIGQVVVYQHLSNELGISGHTVKHWLSLLEASFIIKQLQPYYENFGKRLIKSPKLYFTDVGLACYLLGIEHLSQLARDPLRGHLVENMVIIELMKWRLNQGKEPQLYYYRDSHQHEVDVVFKDANHLTPIEIKSSQTFHPDFLKGIQFFKGLSGERSQKGYLIYTGTLEQSIQGNQLMSYKKCYQIFDER